VLRCGRVRIAGLVLVLAGLVAILSGAFFGCGSFFGWSGRHPVTASTLSPGMPHRLTFDAEAGRRYTVGIQVRFEDASRGGTEAPRTVPAKMPLVVFMKDGRGDVAAQVVGWLDPSEPPTVLLGASGPGGAAELVAERFVGPHPVGKAQPMTVEIDLGVDRLGQARVIGAQAVVYNDALPPSVAIPAAVAAAGAGALVMGVVMLVVSFFRRKGPRRGGIRPRVEV
jgi:hypothetical protein